MTNLGAILAAIGQKMTDLFRPSRDRGFDSKRTVGKRQTMIAICVGHSRRGDKGAESADRLMTEWEFNIGLAYDLKRDLEARNMRAHVFDVYDGSSYGSAMRWLGARVEQIGASVAIELHFNSAGSSAEGFEYLFWHTSKNGERLATKFLRSHRIQFPHARNRGIKPVDASDRGGGFLRHTPCPAVICEPFFGSNFDEWDFYRRHPHDLVECYANAISDYFTTNT